MVTKTKTATATLQVLSGTDGNASATSIVAKKKPVARAAASVVAPTAPVGFVPAYDILMASVEKRFKMSTNLTDRFANSVSSGLLCTDLILGGGYVLGGMYTHAGAEQSAKSTTVTTFIGELLALPADRQPGIIMYIDAEGSFDQRYFQSSVSTAMEAKGVKNIDTKCIFGQQSATAKNEWIIPPRVRYYPDSRGENILQMLSSMLNRMPDKLELDGKWYYVYPFTKENQATLKGLYDKTLFTRHKEFYVPAPNGSPQALIVIDSWPALLSEAADDEDRGDGLASNARMFSQHLPKVKGKLRRKAAILVSINQLREKPMAKGDPRYEPCGLAVKFLSDARIWHTPRAIPHASGKYEVEPSVTVEGGEDTYHYIHFKSVKNKLSTSNQEGWQRIWASDALGVARGFCPVYDTYGYLKSTGQLTGAMKKMSITTKWGLNIPRLSFMDLKNLILLTGKALRTYERELGVDTGTNIRAKCFEQLRSGVGLDLFFSSRNTSSEDEDDAGSADYDADE